MSLVVVGALDGTSEDVRQRAIPRLMMVILTYLPKGNLLLRPNPFEVVFVLACYR